MEPSQLSSGRHLQQPISFQQSTRRSIPTHHVGSSPMTMQIPNKGWPDAPPPLPPPRYVNEDGPPEDQEREPYERPRGFGGYPKTWSHREEGRKPRRLEPLIREAATAPSSWSRSPTDSDRRYERMHRDEGYYSLSGPSISQLPGEKQLHHQHQESSSKSYDRNLLGKLGKPTDSPSRQPTFGSIGSAENSPTVQFSRQNTLRSLSFPNTNSSLLSDPPIKQEPGRFADSPRVSPRTSKAYPEFRSPVFDPHAKPTSYDADTVPRVSQRFPDSINIERQQKSRRSESSVSGSCSLLPRLDESAPGFKLHPVKREFADQPFFSASASDQDSTVRMAERVRHLHLDETTPTDFRFPEFQRGSMSNPAGTKRKLSQDEQTATLTQQAVKATEYFRSPHLATQYGQHHDSISSQSSGYRHDSYASSAGADGSYTSVEHTSPGVSPTSEAYQQYVNQAYDAKPRKQSQPPFHCTCCAKKPKKFQTIEELQQHQNEKQFHCMYCANKFKNKNEMERHQNSIHRRTNSWSCAELDKFEEAFFPSAAFGATGGQFQPALNGASPTDLCGYCGEEFSNEPKDLEARHQHLTATHKFGECNRAKKFWRADHFRQHLKHSHSGKNGKHTNALEQKCAREGPPQLEQNSQANTTPTLANSAPVANMRPPAAIGGPEQVQAQQDQQQQQQQQQSNSLPSPAPAAATSFTMPLDPANIDPSMNILAQGGPPSTQMQGMQRVTASSGNGNGGGYDFKSEA